MGSCLKPVAGASSGPTRVLLRPLCEPRGRWQARPNSHEVAPGPGPVLARFLSGVRAWEAFVGCVLPNGGAGLRRTAREGPPALSVVVEVGEFERPEAG